MIWFFRRHSSRKAPKHPWRLPLIVVAAVIIGLIQNSCSSESQHDAAVKGLTVLPYPTYPQFNWPPKPVTVSYTVPAAQAASINGIKMHVPHLAHMRFFRGHWMIRRVVRGAVRGASYGALSSSWGSGE
jgi:hypothetical protein